MAGQNPANGRNRGRPRECTAPRRAWSGRIWGRGGPHDAFDLQAWLSLDLNRAVIEIGDDHPRAPAGPGQHEHRGRGSPGRGDRIHPDWTEHVERRRQCVGVGGRFSDHCGGDHTLCGEATSRVEDVAEFATAVDEELRARPARAECLVIERDRGEPPSGPQRMPEAHPPAVAVTHRRPLRAPREHAALPPVHEHAGRPASREACDRTVERPALANGAGIDLNARPEKPHAAPLDVKLHMLHAGGRAGSGECGVVGRAALASQEPPGPHERPRGEVERAVRQLPEFATAHEQRPHLRRHVHPARRRRRIDLRELAGRPVDADPLLDLVDEIERVDGQFGVIRHLAGVESHLEATGHRLAADDECVEVVRHRCAHLTAARGPGRRRPGRGGRGQVRSQTAPVKWCRPPARRCANGSGPQADGRGT